MLLIHCPLEQCSKGLHLVNYEKKIKTWKCFVSEISKWGALEGWGWGGCSHVGLRLLL